MRTRTLLATAALTLVSQACLPSTIQLSCADIAEAQCAACERCVDELDQSGVDADARVDASDLCSARFTDSQTCAARLEQRCIDQASGRQDANAELDACFEQLDAADEDTVCEDLYEGWALDKPATTSSCRRFL